MTPPPTSSTSPASGRSAGDSSAIDDSAAGRPSRGSTAARLTAAILLVAAVVASFWVPIYARVTPKLGALPFFYWYQLVLVVAVAIVSYLAFLLLRTDRRAARKLKAARHAAARADERLATEAGGPEAAL